MKVRMISAAQADFRANDRDGNGLNDYWTGDVKSLYTLTSARMDGASKDSTIDPPLKLIDLSIAAADADGSFFSAGGENLRLESFTTPYESAGYWFAALMQDRSVEGPESTYRQDTGGALPMGPCHHLTRYGFVAFPDSKDRGPWVFIINENNTLYRSPLTGPVRLGNKAIPPGLTGIAPDYLNWPDGRTLHEGWSKKD